MKRFALLLAVFTLGFSFAASAYDSDPGYGGEGPRSRGPWYGGHDQQSSLYTGPIGLLPLYYVPTMRYYGNGYTVSYRYVPVYVQNWTTTLDQAPNFPTKSFHLSNEEIAAWGANPARLTVKDPHAASHTAVTTIIRKTTTGKKSGKGAATEAAEEPAISPATPATKSPSPAQDAAPVPGFRGTKP